MTISHFSRPLVTVGLLLGMAPFAVLAAAAPASAATGSAPTVVVACKHLTANAKTDVGKVTGCPSAATGGSGKLSKFLPRGGHISWANATTTTYKDKFTNGGTLCPSGSTEYNLKGSVTASTNTAIPVGAPVKMTVCLAGTKLTNAANTPVRF
jgi:hypothetical protein